MIRAQALVFPAAILFVSAGAGAQGTGTVGGVVTDPDGLAIFGATVSVAGTSLTSKTDESGEFRIVGAPVGSVQLDARRLGFAPQSLQVNVNANSTNDGVHFKLASLPAMLDHVVVQRSSMKYTGRLAGYYQRLERRSSGQFITREELDGSHTRTLSQLLSRRPGINAVALRSGGGAVRMRGRSCRPLVWLDGAPMPAGEVDLDAFPVSTLHGVELYLGSTTAPMDFTAQQNRSSCGSILMWSRGRDTESGRRSPKPVDLEELVASLAVYTADDVDRRVELTDRSRVEAAYPPDMFATRTGGTIVLEFVVDATGRVERNTLAVVSTSDSRLVTPVTRALEQSRFAPALKDGKAVRQFVRQRFDFAPSSVTVSTSN